MSAAAETLRELGMEPPDGTDDAFLALLEAHLTRYQDRVAKVALHVGRLKSIVDHSRDRCDLLTEIRVEVDDLYVLLGGSA